MSSHTQMPSGLYNPIGHSRSVIAPQGHATALARLASYHETMHTFLNSSTNFGCAMIWAGALAEAGDTGFKDLVARMVGASRDTHEIMATVTALCTATGGTLDRNMLSAYPGYIHYLDRFLQVFGTSPRPFLAGIALTSCARAAMQTDIFNQLLGTGCATWPEIVISPAGAPDSRFRMAFTPENSCRAMAAMDAVLAECGSSGRQLTDGVAPALEHRLLFDLSHEIQDRLSAAAFAVYAKALEQEGHSTVAYAVDKNALAGIVTKIEEFAGPRLNTYFTTPNNVTEDLDSVLLEFRREQLILRPVRDPAIFIDCSLPNAGSAGDFVLRSGTGRYLQLVAMPLPKLRYLYEAAYGEALLSQWPGNIVTALRRRWVHPGQVPRIEFYLLRRDELQALLPELSGVEIIPMLSAAALEDPSWRREWVTPGDGPISRLTVLLDTDPFEILQRRAEHLVRTAVIKLRRSTEDTEYTEIFCMVEDDHPAILLFTPCTTPFRQALLDYAQKRCPRWRHDPGIIAAWQDVLERVAGHVLQEERMFGVKFWP